jgi:hypothetical protein
VGLVSIQATKAPDICVELDIAARENFRGTVATLHVSRTSTESMSER